MNTIIPTPKSNDWGLFGLVEFDKPATWEKAVTMLADIANCTLDQAGTVLDTVHGVFIACKLNESPEANLRAEIETWYQLYGARIDYGNPDTY